MVFAKTASYHDEKVRYKMIEIRDPKRRISIDI